ncbi:MAG TPA: ParB/RepB/Spo0J family partition protein [Mycobacterium sp.]|nr:ParB/RepB/Spo0J family partition protein [Mycobacterium sp.]
MNTTSHDHEQLCWAHDWLASEHDIVHVPVASLRPGDSPRLKGESKEHIASMVEAIETRPIIVHQPTMQVIDGMHRLTAATLRGQDSIAVWFFDGTIEECFVLAVAANITHGLPLSTKDRKAAVARILGMYPDCSDRSIAMAAGLSHPTVATIRLWRSTGKNFQSNSRRGKDGRTRPLTANEGREAAARLLLTDQSKTLREVARQTGVSLSTVHDVRDRLARGVSPVVSMTPRGTILNVHLARAGVALQRLWDNSAVRSHEKNRVMLKLLARSLGTAEDAQAACRNASELCRGAVAEIAADEGNAWIRLAQELRSRADVG